MSTYLTPVRSESQLFVFTAIFFAVSLIKAERKIMPVTLEATLTFHSSICLGTLVQHMLFYKPTGNSVWLLWETHTSYPSNYHWSKTPNVE